MMFAAGLSGKISSYAAQLAGRKIEGCEMAGGPWPLLPLNQVPEETGDLWPGYVESSGRRSVLGLKLSEADCGLDDKEGDLFEQYNDDGHLCENAGPLEASNFWFCEDTEVFLGRGISSLGSGTEGLELMIALGSADDLGDESGMGFHRHVFDKAVVVDPVRTIPGEGGEVWIAGFHTLPAAGEGCSC